MRSMVFALLAGFLAVTAPAWADDDDQEHAVERGAKVFVRCKACHENQLGLNKVGPTLKGVVGRPTATVPNFTYSDAMKARGAAGQVWDEATLAAYLPDPRGFIPGIKMAFAGLKDPQKVADVIAYLKANP
jgi:cytochrome c